MPEVAVVFVLLLNRTELFAPTTFVAVVDVVEFPLNAPENVVQFKVFVLALNVKSPSVSAVVIVPLVKLVSTTLSVPDAADKEAPVFVS